MKKWFNILLFALCLASCDVTEPEVPTEIYKVRMNISIPVDDQSTGRSRMPGLGDPGTFERFSYPRYLYFYYVIENKSTLATEVHRNCIQQLPAEAWTNGHYTGNLQYDYDSIFTYTGELEMELPKDLTGYNIRIYAAMSYHPLARLVTTDVATESEIHNLTFDLDNDSLLENIENIYSTPFNYEINGSYYGTMPAAKIGQYTFNLLLYHVASKVDLIWNVPDDQQTTFNVNQIIARQLYKKSSYIFRPNQNNGKPDIGNPGESYSITVKTSDDIGMQYKGRYYFYTIPYYYEEGGKDYFDIVLDTKFSNGGVVQDNVILTLKKMVDINEPFVPWIRGNMQFTTMPTITQVKIVD